MLRSLEELKGYAIHATDGDIGNVEDVYFDEGHWTVRYFVVNTGNWLTGRRVLISPIVFRDADWHAKKILVTLTREQVKNSPDFDTHKPVSRQHEIELARYFNWAPYWM